MTMFDLWLPILASAAGVFVASSVLWMAVPLHKRDYLPLKDDRPVQEALRSQSLAPGRYMFPNRMGPDGKPKDLSKSAGPWGLVSILKPPSGMGPLLGMWFLNILVISILIGYVASIGVLQGSSSGHVFRFVSVAALLAYAGGILPRAIWEGLPWGSLPGAVLDAVVYAAVTGVLFAVLWP